MKNRPPRNSVKPSLTILQGEAPLYRFIYVATMLRRRGFKVEGYFEGADCLRKVGKRKFKYWNGCYPQDVTLNIDKDFSEIMGLSVRKT